MTDALDNGISTYLPSIPPSLPPSLPPLLLPFPGRYSFLKHLPLYSHVQLVELALPPSLLSSPTYETFKSEIKKRAQRRKQKGKAEERREEAAAAAAARNGGREGGREGLTEEEVRAIQARRERGVDLNGPLPWQAALMAEGGREGAQEEQVQEGLEEQGGVSSGSPPEGGGREGGREERGGWDPLPR